MQKEYQTFGIIYIYIDPDIDHINLFVIKMKIVVVFCAKRGKIAYDATIARQHYFFQH